MKAVIVVALLSLIVTISVDAHHSPANYDLTVTDFAIKGTVKSAEFRNPHSKLVLIVKDAKGKEAEWDIEFSSINLLVRRGWKLSDIKYGDTVRCIGNPDKTGAKHMYMWSIKLADGREFSK